MNLWKLSYVDKDRELDIEILVKAKSLDSALSLAYHISKKRTLILKAIKQIWVDIAGRSYLEEKKINAI